MTLIGTDVHTMIRDYIAQNLLFSDTGFPYSDDTSFMEEHIIDSLGVMDLVMFVEEKFGIAMQDEDVTPENLDSVNRLASYVQRKLAE